LQLSRAPILASIVWTVVSVSTVTVVSRTWLAQTPCRSIACSRRI
jgi:hypothetical protein